GAGRAAGRADAALGTDSGGSIRIPAACCGVVGFKPTFDLVRTDGCFPLAASFDHVGPMARSVEECEAMLRALAPEFASVAEPETLRVAVAWAEHADPLVRQRVEDAAAALGATRIEFPLESETSALFMREVADVHRELYAENGELYGENVAVKIERCVAVTEAEANTARAARERYRQAAETARYGLGHRLTPTLSSVAPPVGIGDAALRQQMTRFTYPFNALGWPVLALPCGAAEDDLPASAQLIGRAGDDGRVLAAGRHLQGLLNVERASSARSG